MAEDKPTYEELEQKLFQIKSELEKSVERENHLIEGETKFRLLYENSLDAILITSPDGKVFSVNPMGCKMFGWTEEEICNGGRNLIVDENDKGIQKAIEIRSEIGYYKGELLCKRKDGTKFTGEFSSKIFTNNKGLLRTSMIIRDVSSRKEYEQLIIDREKKFKELNAKKDKFFSIIAHDLRSPFNSILGLSDLLIKNLKEFEIAEFENYLTLIQTSAKNTLILLDNLLNWAKSQTGQLRFKPEKIILSDVIHKIIELKYSLINSKNILIDYNLPDETEVYTDENMLRLILRNLISNAVKFTKPGGHILISAVSNKKEIVISVSDNGVGMNKETSEKLFDIATNITTPGTADEKGSGLGLVLCKEFVEKLGGNIWVESKVDKGSKFSFNIPES